MIIKGFMKFCIPCPASMEAPTFQTQLSFHLQENHSVELKKPWIEPLLSLLWDTWDFLPVNIIPTSPKYDPLCGANVLGKFCLVQDVDFHQFSWSLCKLNEIFLLLLFSSSVISDSS